MCLLAQWGLELGEPLAHHLGDGIWALSIRRGDAVRRVLYFHGGHYGRNVAILAHTCRRVSAEALLADPPGHVYEDRRLPMPRTRDATAILGQLTGNDEELHDLIADAALHAQVARAIYDARTVAGLTQVQLAAMVGTKQPGIARLEDADYGGRSLSMLQRVAAALQHRIELRFVSRDGPRRDPLPGQTTARR